MRGWWITNRVLCCETQIIKLIQPPFSTLIFKDEHIPSSVLNWKGLWEHVVFLHHLHNATRVSHFNAYLRENESHGKRVKRQSRERWALRTCWTWTDCSVLSTTLLIHPKHFPHNFRQSTCWSNEHFGSEIGHGKIEKLWFRVTIFTQKPTRGYMDSLNRVIVTCHPSSRSNNLKMYTKKPIEKHLNMSIDVGY